MLQGTDFLPLPEPNGPPNVTRFAPSPTGLLHLGHAYAALIAYESARSCGGRFLLRIEDIDRSRCRSEFEEAIYEDMEWLGLRWDGVALRQSERLTAYNLALSRLDELGVLYPCFCTRKQIRAEVARAGRAPHAGEELVYPGICRSLLPAERLSRIRRGLPFALRLDVGRAAALVGALQWYDVRAGWVRAEPQRHGDVVLARKDAPSSYHLAVTVDDAFQRVTLVTRGEDLFHATHVHRLLQALLELPVPRYYHHNLIAGADGQRLAKRNRAQSVRGLRAAGRRPDDVWRLLGLPDPAPVPA